MGVFLPLIGYGAKALAGTAVAGGGTAAASQGLLSIPGARNLFGLTADDIAKGESYDLNDPSTYRDDIGDHLRSFFTGVSTNEVKEKARAQAVKKVNQSLGTRYDAIKTGYESLGLKAPERSEFQYGRGNNEGTETTAAAGLRATQRELQLQALQNADATGVDVTGLSNASPSSIKNAQRLHIKGENEADRQRIRGEALSDQATIFARQDAKEARLRADTLAEQMRRDKNTEANRAQQFQIQQMQLGLENRRLDMQEARNFRNDRHKAIMQIVQGMRAMGNSFAY